MHRKTTENAVFTRNFEFIDPLRSFDRNMVFNYTNLTIRKGLENRPAHAEAHNRQGRKARHRGKGNHHTRLQGGIRL